jgi:peptide/nickel transport system ATP-binding protein
MSQVLSHEPTEHTDGKPLLRVDDLNVAFTKLSGFFIRERVTVKAVDHVSFDLFEGETLSLVGESGSGKTTIAKCLIRLIEQNSGRILFDSNDITKLSGTAAVRKYRKDVQIIYQDPFESLNPREDVLTAVSTPVRLLLGEKDTGKIRSIVSGLTEEVGLESETVLRKYPHQLSGGERQRVNIARALACNPRLLVADEPITMLDASQRLNILSLLTKLKKDRNLTILLITHDLASAKVMSDRTAIMFHGRIVETGSTGIVLSKPHHPYTQLILDTIPKRKKEVGSSSRYLGSSFEEVVLGCSFRSRCKYATEICQKVEPELEEKSASHWAACHNPLNN